MNELKEYYNPRYLPLLGKAALTVNLILFFMNLQKFPLSTSLLILISTVSCSLPLIFRHRQRNIADFVFFRRIIMPGFLGLTLSVILIILFGAELAGLPYGVSRYEALGIFCRRRGLFFIIVSDLSLIQMVLKEAVPQEQRRPYLLLLVIPLALLAFL